MAAVLIELPAAIMQQSQYAPPKSSRHAEATPAAWIVVAGALGRFMRVAYFDCGTCGVAGSEFGVAGAFAGGAPPNCSSTPWPL